ncbi:MAG: TlpA family protein disulfide reductase, partial [Saprospiraceae bacterium]|nr:TlpA family protein disulfide reductase [Saprospiraceae bacterium]
YGTGVRHFSEFKSVGEFTFPYGEVYSVPGSGYRTIREVEEIELMPEFGSEEFLHDDRWQVIKTGETIPDFQVAIFPTGEKLAKEDLLGKTTLIDFWATWCKPCIAEFPNIRSAYERFQPSGFEVLSISLDQNQDMLESFLEEEDLPWINAYEPKGFDSELASDFQLAAIPKPILVDQNGIIIVVDKEATGEGLNKLLETIF